MARSGDYDIPFDRKGNQQHYPESWARISWRPNVAHEDTLRYVEYRRGRSAAYFVFQNNEGKERIMFLKDFEEVVKHMVRGHVRGRWMFIKRGMNYGIRYVGPCADYDNSHSIEAADSAHGTSTDLALS